MSEPLAPETDEPKYVLFQIGEGWSALYVDGRLDQIGDTHNVEERIQQILGVAWQESPVMDAVQQRNEAPPTLLELRRLEAEHEDRSRRAAELRAQAEALEAEAAALVIRPTQPAK